MQTENPEKLLSRVEAADRLGVTVACLEAWACRGRPKLRYFRVGKLVKYRAGDIVDFLRARSGTSATEISHALADAGA